MGSPLQTKVFMGRIWEKMGIPFQIPFQKQGFHRKQKWKNQRNGIHMEYFMGQSLK
jgi:hypothetical protein